MIEEPYRWLEAIGNRREYVRDQIKGGSPVFAASLPDGIILVGVGGGNSKVFEIFDRHALAGLGHPADIEKIRQAAIDAAHMEAFTRAPEDVSLRRLVSFGLSPQLKTSFEQIFSAPFMVELILTELGPHPDQDLMVRLHFNGGYQSQNKGVLVAAGNEEVEALAQQWLTKELAEKKDRSQAVELLLQAWWCIVKRKFENESNKNDPDKKFSLDDLPSEAERRDGWRKAIEGKTVEIGWLARQSPRLARFEMLTLNQIGL